MLNRFRIKPQKERVITEIAPYKTGGCVVDTELVGLLAVSMVFSAIAIIEGVIVSPIFYSMAGMILAMLGYFIISDRLGQKKSEEPPQQKE